MKYFKKLQSILDELSEKHGWDWGIKFEVGHEYGGSLELRITREPNSNQKIDLSEVYFLAGLDDLDEGAKALWQKFRSIK